MNSDQLREHYKRLLEAGPAVPVEQDPAMQEAPDAPELQNTQAPEAQPQMGLTRPVNIPRFTPNLHRYAYRAGEVVNFFNDQGALVQASIVGPPQGDRYDVVDTEGQQYEVIKSELFYPAMQMQAEMGMGEEMPPQSPPQNSA